MLMYSLAARATTCMSPIIPAQPTPMLSLILKTFFATLLMTKVPYEYLRSDARIAPSLHTSPTVVAPGIKPSSLINRAESANLCSVAIKVATSEQSPSRRFGLRRNMVSQLSLGTSINPVRNVRIVPVDRSDGESVLETSKHKVPIPIGEFKKLVPLLAFQET